MDFSHCQRTDRTLFNEQPISRIQNNVTTVKKQHHLEAWMIVLQMKCGEMWNSGAPAT